MHCRKVNLRLIGMNTFGVEIIPRAKLMEVVKTLGKGMVPRAGVEPARPFGQRILSPFPISKHLENGHATPLALHLNIATSGGQQVDVSK